MRRLVFLINALQYLLPIWSNKFLTVTDVAVCDLFNATNAGRVLKGWKCYGGHPVTSICNGNHSYWEGIYCDDNNVVRISIRHRSLSGSLPSSLGMLRNLTYLSFLGNDLHGTIPKSFGSLDKLKYLSLQDNSLDGIIPSSLGGLQNLEELWLISNSFSGTLPAQLGELKKLQYFSISDNNIEGKIPNSFSRLESLKFMQVDGNKMSGLIPTSFCTSMPNLSLLYLNWYQTDTSKHNNKNRFKCLPACLLTHVPNLQYGGLLPCHNDEVPSFIWTAFWSVFDLPWPLELFLTISNYNGPDGVDVFAAISEVSTRGISAIKIVAAWANNGLLQLVPAARSVLGGDAKGGGEIPPVSAEVKNKKEDETQRPAIEIASCPLDSVTEMRPGEELCLPSRETGGRRRPENLDSTHQTSSNRRAGRRSKAGNKKQKPSIYSWIYFYRSSVFGTILVSVGSSVVAAGLSFVTVSMVYSGMSSWGAESPAALMETYQMVAAAA